MRRYGALVLVVASSVAAQERVSLAELAQIARARSEEQRPAQLAALQPFLADLELDYDEQNRSYLDQRFELAAGLGDAIVPELCARLRPAEPSDRKARNVAENSARILGMMDPSGFVDALIDVTESSDATARRHAIRLLGRTRSPLAGRTLTRLLGEVPPGERVEIIDALTELRAVDAAPQIVDYLGSQDPALRREALQFLAATQAPAVLPTVLEALAAEASAENVPLYVRYLEGAAPRSAAAAETLLKLMQTSDQEVVELIARALARIAPVGHQPSIAACRAILELEETGRLGRACALTMEALGDDSGTDKLMAVLKRQISNAPRNEHLHAELAELYRSLGRWSHAASAYEDAIERTNNATWKSDLYLLVARCEAHRRRWPAVLTALRASLAGRTAIELAAADDEALARALKHRPIRVWLEQLEQGANPRRVSR